MASRIKIILSILYLITANIVFCNDTIKCSTADIFQNRAANNPSLLLQQQQLETEIQQWIQQHQNNRENADAALIVIPLVVHVVYNTAQQNISDEQILSQINVLNNDFRKLNTDRLHSSHPYYNLSGNANIEFCLAKIDKNGNATTGIVRTATSITEFDGNPINTSDEKVKFSNQGGDDFWDAKKYLNIWVCKLSGGTLGYAQFPSVFSSSPETDGVVIDYRYFGTIGTVTAPYNLGRTATHEIGHWLNLYHIWGDANCGDDEVNDTPTQASENYDCPTFPHISCSNGPNGDLFMNFMDYTDDGCMSMFTNGQVDRMAAILNGVRNDIVTANKCSGTTGFLQQKVESIKIYPNPVQNYLNIAGLPFTKYPLITIDILNILGEKVYTTTFSTVSNVQLEMPNVDAGTYIMNIYNAAFSFNQKLTVVR
jgi:hypothetical protein